MTGILLAPLLLFVLLVASLLSLFIFIVNIIMNGVETIHPFQCLPLKMIGINLCGICWTAYRSHSPPCRLLAWHFTPLYNVLQCDILDSFLVNVQQQQQLLLLLLCLHLVPRLETSWVESNWVGRCERDSHTQTTAYTQMRFRATHTETIRRSMSMSWITSGFRVWRCWAPIRICQLIAYFNPFLQFNFIC